MKKNRSTFFWLYVLGTYIMLQFFWWAWLLIDQTIEINSLHLLFGMDTGQAIEKGILDRRVLMIFGEGGVFFILLVLGFLKVRSTMRKELSIAHQQKNFLLSVTHELNTPLASIKLFLQTILKRNLPQDTRDELTTNALEETERLRELVQNILTTARIEDGQMRIHKQTKNLSAFITQELDTVLPLLKTHVVEKNIEDNINTEFDENAMRSIFLNLLENAEKYSPPSSKISISLSKVNNKIVLSIQDEGIGIEKEELNSIYNKFYRVENESTRENKGTGLGLFIVKQLVDLHGGVIEYKKALPKGSVFSIIV